MTIIATYTDEAGAVLLTKYISSCGGQSYVTTSAAPGLAVFHVSVPSGLLDEVARLLDSAVIATYNDPISAKVVAGRLISESVPCWLAGRATRLGLEGAYSGPYTLSVPKACLSEAERVLNEPPVSDSELTDLALRTPPEADAPT